MRFSRYFLMVSAACVAMLCAPQVEAKPAAAKDKAERVQAKKKEPDTVIKVIDLAKAKAKDTKKLEKALKKVKGVTSAIVAKKKGEVKIWHKAEVQKADLVAAIKAAGFKVEGDDDEEAPAEPEPEEDTGGDEYQE